MGTEIELRQMGMSDLTRAGIEVASVDVSLHPNHDTGVRIEVMFPNGYGASVIRTERSYGGPSGLFELCVLNSAGDLVKRSPIIDIDKTGDYVIGWLTATEVLDLFRRIAALDQPTD